MATIKYIVHGALRKDNTYRCAIRITHNRESAYINSGVYVGKADVTKAGKIKDKLAIAKLEDITNEYRKKLLKLDDVMDLSAREIADLLAKKDARFRLDFIEYTERKIKSMKPGTAKGYRAMLSKLRAIAGDKLPIEHLNRSLLNSLCAELVDYRTSGCKTLSCLRAMFKMACDEYNGEHIDTWKIRHNPFNGFKVPREKMSDNRALSLDQVREIVLMPYLTKDDTSFYKRANMGRDVFVLSLCLLGVNIVDIYTCDDIKGDIITYNRQKTKDSRPDEALMVVNIHPLIRHLVDKYRDGSSFIFKSKYSSIDTFTRCTNIGLQMFQKFANIRMSEKGVPTIDGHLTTYYARHTMATIAQNELGIDKYTVSELLNHSQVGALRTTDRYTKKDWSRLHEINNRIVELVFNKEATI